MLRTFIFQDSEKMLSEQAAEKVCCRERLHQVQGEKKSTQSEVRHRTRRTGRSFSATQGEASLGYMRVSPEAINKGIQTTREGEDVKERKNLAEGGDAKKNV